MLRPPIRRLHRRLDAYAKDGDGYFALSLSPTMARPAAKPRDVVILFDTSASQMGQYRDKALAALDTTLAALAPTDRVRLFAVDLNAIPLTEKFVTPTGPEIRTARRRCAIACRWGRPIWKPRSPR